MSVVATFSYVTRVVETVIYQCQIYSEIHQYPQSSGNSDVYEIDNLATNLENNRLENMYLPSKVTGQFATSFNRMMFFNNRINY